MSDSSFPDPIRRRVGLALAAAPLAGAFGCATGPPLAVSPVEPVTAPRVRVGDRWRYVEINRYNNIPQGELTAEVAEASPLVRVKLTYSNGQQRPDELYVDPWWVVQEPSYDLLQFFDSPVPLIPRELVSGARERLSTAYHLDGGYRSYPWTIYLDARGWERIRVPAGEFECLRVDRQIFFTHSEYWRYQSVRSDRIWYAPRINRWVQREWFGDFQMASRRMARNHEDFVRWQLLDYVPAPTA